MATTQTAPHNIPACILTASFCLPVCTGDVNAATTADDDDEVDDAEVDATDPFGMLPPPTTGWPVPGVPALTVVVVVVVIVALHGGMTDARVVALVDGGGGGVRPPHVASMPQSSGAETGIALGKGVPKVMVGGVVLKVTLVLQLPRAETERAEGQWLWFGFERAMEARRWRRRKRHAKEWCIVGTAAWLDLVWLGWMGWDGEKDGKGGVWVLNETGEIAGKKEEALGYVFLFVGYERRTVWSVG